MKYMFSMNKNYMKIFQKIKTIKMKLKIIVNLMYQIRKIKILNYIEL